MNMKLFLLIVFSVGLSSVAQILLKIGMTSKSDHVDSTIAGWARVIMNALMNPSVITGLMLYGLGTILWLAVLSRLDVTQAYPFVGLGFIITMILGYLILGESVGYQRILGTLLITSGIILVARS